jgi:hypothetical protein
VIAAVQAVNRLGRDGIDHRVAFPQAKRVPKSPAKAAST